MLSSYPLTHPDKVLYPEAGITKRELLGYYALVAERMLPHVANRPLTLVRCPDGRGKPCFFQKHPGRGTPRSVRSIPIREKEREAPYAVIDDEAGLFGLVQLGSLEIHTWGARAADAERPDILVFDLDPDPAVAFGEVVRAAEELRRLFDTAELESFPKTTGGKGLHVCVPIAPELDWTKTKDLARRIAESLVARFPHRYVASAAKEKRRGKIFVDHLRNARGATFIAPYSTRASEGGPVALPLSWEELAAGIDPRTFTFRSVARRLQHQDADPFARLATLKQSLTRLLATSARA
jgi:bifunctional non-homologous end joining protein LigD